MSADTLRQDQLCPAQHSPLSFSCWKQPGKKKEILMNNCPSSASSWPALAFTRTIKFSVLLEKRRTHKIIVFIIKACWVSLKRLEWKTATTDEPNENKWLMVIYANWSNTPHIPRSMLNNRFIVLDEKCCHWLPRVVFLQLAYSCDHNLTSP